MKGGEIDIDIDVNINIHADIDIKLSSAVVQRPEGVCMVMEML